MTSISEAQSLDIHFIETIDKILERIPGEVGTCAVHCMLRVRFGLDKTSIPDRTEYFRASLIELLDSGGDVLLMMIDNETRDDP